MPKIENPFLRNDTWDTSKKTKTGLFQSSTTQSWAPNGTIISAASNGQYWPEICSDGAEGAIITWWDTRSGSNFDIYAQRIDLSGKVQWATDGVAICIANNDQYNPKICSDGAEGAIITWFDNRSGSNYDIYTQKINSSGEVQWDADGVSICTAIRGQTDPQICSDGAGGAIITWEDLRGGHSGSGYDIYVQRIDSSGNIKWTADGVAICNASNNQYNPEICSDGAGGAIITWEDNSEGTSFDIYSQRINASGNVEWTTNGVAICTRAYNQHLPQICSDEVGGAIITWYDFRIGGLHSDIYAQRINSSGNIQWIENGLTICEAIWSQFYPKICTNGAGGVIITWEDYRNGHSTNIYGQNVNATGDIQWIIDGVSICKAINDQFNPELCYDGAMGAIITWYDNRTGSNYDIYAQSINSSGKIQWIADGVVICTAINNNNLHNPQICSDGLGAAIITWSDFRSGSGGSGSDIYAQHTSYDPTDEEIPTDGEIPFEIIIAIVSLVGIAVVIGIATTLIIKKRRKR
jgi:hypothetical protein